MNKRGQALVFLFIALVAITAGVVYYFNYYQPSHPIIPNNLNNSNNTNSQGNNTINNNTLNISQQNLSSIDKYLNISEIHWNHMPLTYMIINESLCAGKPIETLKKAMGFVEEASNNTIKFKINSTNNADIIISCYNLKDVLNKTGITCKNFSVEWNKRDFNAKKEGYIDNSSYVVSEIEIVRNDSLTTYQACYANSKNANGALDEAKIIIKGNLITNGTMNLYGDDLNSCSKLPNVETHQLLHLLGFAHSEEPRFHNIFGWGVTNFHYLEDIMFQYYSCAFQKKIQLKYGSCLQYIYSNGKQGECVKVDFVN